MDKADITSADLRLLAGDACPLLRAAATIEALQARLEQLTSSPRREENQAALAYRRGLEDAAQIADFYMVEHFRLADDTITTDPVIARRDTSASAMAISERLAEDGALYAVMAHVAKRIATDIRERAADEKTPMPSVGIGRL